MSKSTPSPLAGDVAVSIEEKTAINQGVIIQGDVIINQAPKPAEHHAAAYKRQQPSKPSAPHVANVQAATASSLTASGGHHYIDNDRGNQRHTLIDKEGDKVTVVIDRETGHTTMTFNDRSVHFTATSNEPGFSGQRRVPYGYSGTQSIQMDVKSGVLFNAATIHCADNVPFLSLAGIDFDTTKTTNANIDQLNVREIQEFMKRNPELGAELRGMNVPVTQAAGHTLTVAALNRLTPPPAQACPTGRDDDYIGRVQR